MEQNDVGKYVAYATTLRIKRIRAFQMIQLLIQWNWYAEPEYLNRDETAISEHIYLHRFLSSSLSLSPSTVQSLAFHHTFIDCKLRR